MDTTTPAGQPATFTSADGTVRCKCHHLTLDACPTYSTCRIEFQIDADALAEFRQALARVEAPHQPDELDAATRAGDSWAAEFTLASDTERTALSLGYRRGWLDRARGVER